MLDERHPAPRHVIVAFPEEIDVTNAGQVEAELILAVGRDATLIADMGATIFCDCAGARAIYRAWERATATGSEFRVVITTAPVRRLFSLLGIDQMISIYPGLDAAVAAGAPQGGPAAPSPGQLQPDPECHLAAGACDSQMLNGLESW